MATRPRRLWILTAFLLTLAVLLFAVFVWMPGSTASRFRELRAQGAPLQLEDLRPEAPVPDDQNAAVLIRHIQQELNALTESLHPVYNGPYLNNALTDGQAQRIAATFTGQPTFWSTLEKAARLPQYQPLIASETADTKTFLQASMERTQRNRALIRAVKARALALKHQGDSTGALEACLQGFQLCRHFQREPLLVHFMTNSAIESMLFQLLTDLLPPGTLADEEREVLAAIETHLKQHDALANLQRALLSERAYGLESFSELSHGLGRLNPSLRGQPEAYADLIQAELELLQQDPPEIARAAPPAKGGSPLLDTMVPQMVACRASALRNLAFQRAALGLLEGERSSFSSFRSNCLDPFTGEPMQIRHDDRGLAVYSVGPDGTDQGGILSGGQDIGLRAPQLKLVPLTDDGDSSSPDP